MCVGLWESRGAALIQLGAAKDLDSSLGPEALPRLSGFYRNLRRSGTQVLGFWLPLCPAPHLAVCVWVAQLPLEGRVGGCIS